MDTQLQTEAFDLIETLINAGQQLPIPRERAGGILSLREPATRTDVQVLRHALGKSEHLVEN